MRMSDRLDACNTKLSRALAKLWSAVRLRTAFLTQGTA
jgi:hypothetical protein